MTVTVLLKFTGFKLRKIKLRKWHYFMWNSPIICGPVHVHQKLERVQKHLYNLFQGLVLTFVILVKYCTLFLLFPLTAFISCEVNFGQGGNLWKKMPKWKAACRQKKCRELPVAVRSRAEQRLRYLRSVSPCKRKLDQLEGIKNAGEFSLLLLGHKWGWATWNC